MKSNFRIHTLMLVVGVFMSLSTIAQPIVNSGFYGGIKAGTLLNGKVQFYEGILNPKNTTSTGIVLGRDITRDYSVEVEYTWAMGAKTFYNAYGNLNNSFETRLNTHYFMVNGIHYFNFSEKVFPYAMTGPGLAFYSMGNRDDGLLFAFNLGGGAKIPLANSLELNLQSRIMLPMVFSGTGLFFGVNSSGLSTNVYAETTVVMLQGELSAGLQYRF